jgi:hypothetical protein
MARALCLLVGVTITAVSPTLPAQAQTTAQGRITPDSALRRAAETISTADFRVKLAALAHDSTRGRETPSPELQKATEWVAERFRAAGLRPAGDAGGYLQHFDIRQVKLDSLTTVSVTQGGRVTPWALGRDVVYAVGGSPIAVIDAPVVLVTGVPADTAHPFGHVPVRGAVLLHVLAPDQLSGRVLNPLHQRADAEGVAAHIVAWDIPGDMWSDLVRRSFPERWEIAGVVPRGGLRMAVYGLRLAAASPLLAASGADPAALGGAVRPLPGVTITITPHDTVLRQATVANVVGEIEGSVRGLSDEAVLFTSHMDHVGVIPGRCRPSPEMPSDSICNGADDNASGTVGVIELAEAFAALHPRPGRTLIFAAMTAEERGLFGSRYYAAHPRVPLERTAAVLNLDMIARNPPDTAGFVGKDYTSLGRLVDEALRAHPELGLVAAEHPGRFAASDHWPFAQQGVASLFFFSGEHADLHTAADNPERADADQAARITRLAFYVGCAVANAGGRPAWDPEARARIVAR